MLTHLDPTPDSGKERRGINDNDGAQRFWIVGRSERRCFLEMRPEGPEERQRDVGEVDDRRHGRDWGWLNASGEMAA